jgi:hypothetical protein
VRRVDLEAGHPVTYGQAAEQEHAGIIPAENVTRTGVDLGDGSGDGEVEGRHQVDRAELHSGGRSEDKPGVRHFQRERFNMRRLAIILALVGGLSACDAGESYDRAVEAETQRIMAEGQKLNDQITVQVAQDAERQYRIVAEGGGRAMDRCVQAGIVAASWLQANAAGRYQEWKEIERRDCRAAGISQ